MELDRLYSKSASELRSSSELRWWLRNYQRNAP